MNILPAYPQSSKHLPCTLIPLSNWKLIKVEGIDAIQYLQGQLTYDLHAIQIDQYALSAHCNPQGKIINTMYVFHLNSGIGLIERYDICNKQIKEMKKYAVFSKVKINIDNYVSLFGVAGLNARQILKNFFENLPNKTTTIIRNLNVTILHFNLPEERFLLIVANTIKMKIIQLLTSKMKISNHIQWTTLDIESGYPIISHETSEQIVPQDANMHLLNSISFNKGCYIGQEMIARMQYKNINKRGLYWLIGSHATNIPKIGQKLTIKTNNSWKLTGLTLMPCILNTGEIWIQAILPHAIHNNNIPIKIIANDNNTVLTISPLPYIKHVLLKNNK